MRRLAYVLGIVAFGVSPLVLSDYGLYLLTLIAVVSLIALGQNIVTGVAGQASLAQGAFAALGGYGAALLATKLGMPIWLAILLAALAAAVIGYLVALPALRLEGPYLALVTLAFTAIVQTVLIQWVALTNGSLGLEVPALTLAGRLIKSSTALYLVVLPVTAALIVVAARVLDSRIGRAFDALRQSEVAGRTAGINPVRYKTLAFAISAFYGAVGGGLQSLLTAFLSPETFGILESIYYLVVIVIGGLGGIGGAVVGSAVLVLLPEVLGPFRQYQGMVYGVLLLAFIVFAPRGVYGLALQLGAAARRAALIAR